MTDKLLDFNKKREAAIEQKRRSFERILFQNFLGAYSVIDQAGSVYPIELVDISKEGCLFQIPWDVKSGTPYQAGHELSLRIYFTKDSYIPTTVAVKHSSETVAQNGNTYMQYGCTFDKSLPSFEALQSFIDFLYKFAEHSAIDRGDSRVYFL